MRSETRQLVQNRVWHITCDSSIKGNNISVDHSPHSTSYVIFIITTTINTITITTCSSLTSTCMQHASEQLHSDPCPNAQRMPSKYKTNKNKEDVCQSKISPEMRCRKIHKCSVLQSNHPEPKPQPFCHARAHNTNAARSLTRRNPPCA